MGAASSSASAAAIAAAIATPDLNGDMIDIEASRELGREYLATQHKCYYMASWYANIVKWDATSGLVLNNVVPRNADVPTRTVVMMMAAMMVPFMFDGLSLEKSIICVVIRMIGLSGGVAVGGFNPDEVVEKVVDVSVAAEIETNFVNMISVPGKTTDEVRAEFRKALHCLVTDGYAVFKMAVKGAPQLAQAWKLVLACSVVCFLRLGHHCRTEEQNKAPFVDLTLAIFKSMTEEKMYHDLFLADVHMQHGLVRLGMHFLILRARVKYAIELLMRNISFKGAKLRIQGAGFEYSALAICANFATEILDLVVDPKNNSHLIPRDIYEAAQWFHAQKVKDFTTIEEYFAGPGALSGVTSMIGGTPAGADHLAACKSYLTKHQRLCLGILYTANTSWKKSIVLSKGLTTSEIRDIEDRYTAYRGALPTSPDGRLAAMSAIFKSMDQATKEKASGAGALVKMLTEGEGSSSGAAASGSTAAAASSK